MITVNHLLQIDESNGLRKVEAKVSYFCMTKKSIVWRSRKTAPKNEWRFTILQMAKEKDASEYVQITDTEQSELDARAEAEREIVCTV
ncbi:hypothetical protein GCK72_015333 [Caenorhabditis remanei]|uniref:Uncharacterized protein n=1 Tax=Caenorhabditis remanei TaxID=31234 RepID=A0A6A5GWS6_CAERE|nr:hypothetical protein GCK72_015333 [Caenorhabditis remanei]KAF1758873.1 hypothetical protein GCK72_015333 [Caenorhabditis remanei]